MYTSISHPKKRGEWVELQFLNRAVAFGLAVSKPWGDCTRYDFIIDCGGGRLLRIQVKGTRARLKDGYACSVHSHPPGHQPVPYTAADVDFLALYIIPEDLWYIIPVQALAGIRRGIFLSPRDPGNRYFRYLDAWHLFRP